MLDDEVLTAYARWEHQDAPYSSAYTTSKFAQYTFEVEYKWGARRFVPRLTLPKDSGIIFHAYQWSLKPWPSGLEYQLKQPNHQGEVVLVRTRAKVTGPDQVDLGTLGARKGATKTSTGEVDDPNGWNQIRIDVDKDASAFFLNGEPLGQIRQAEYFNPILRFWMPLTAGRIVLQAEGAQISWRNATISPLRQKLK